MCCAVIVHTKTGGIANETTGEKNTDTLGGKRPETAGDPIRQNGTAGSAK